jgi:energy-coupling factor transporter ATP-binding protein EcfA2
MDNPEQITYFGQTDARNRRLTFGIKAKDRTKHVYVIGKTGMGKSTLLENMAVQDIRNGNGFAFVDPHGSAVDTLLEYIPKERIKDVVYFAPFDMSHPISFNVMEDVGYDKRHLVVSGLMSTFKKIWQDAWSARMEYILANCILALLDTPGTTLLGIPRMLVDRDYRQKIINNLKDPVVKSFWVNEYEEWEPRYRNEAIAPVQNKVGQFLNVSFVRSHEINNKVNILAISGI